MKPLRVASGQFAALFLSVPSRDPSELPWSPNQDTGVGSTRKEVVMDATPAMTTDVPLVWTVEEAGRLLGISRAHAYELVARGELPHLRLGRRVVVPKHLLAMLLDVPGVDHRPDS